ncbi:oligopeptide transport system ATP-binding protein [Aneurinibacillus soli]|uniref:Oligopeptide transport ATP-binding protein OppD n=1 Tax=Aneurinibacillus soli TaxID=1500254 RepID=A0A0U5AZB8_9BACL|nr:ABC transporter ATP-binding protein [Aneurinibacillus soli]PYE62828.1 oligopeptide transport system ATP-binding protein [Aneurinibacillus soli]BAU29114.1 Oligopeptide transport ATP-binding protein OppD [Aneurinibacillus soli]
MALLEVRDLSVSFHTYAGEVQAVRGVSFTVSKGETIGIVGESGCGKSVTAQSIMKLLPEPLVNYKHGQILFNDQDLLQKEEKAMQQVRGNDIGMIFQDPMTSLNPTMHVGDQIVEGLVKHQGLSHRDAHERAVEALRLVGISQPDERVRQYPHEFSGGMRQRAMIAIALACRPKLLLADEPTTALDVTIQAQILELMKKLQAQTGTAIILITHDLGVVADICDRVVVMYAGEVVEMGTVDQIFYTSKHPYTSGLLASVPRLNMNRHDSLHPIMGTPPDLLHPPVGCSFFARCSYAMEVCRVHKPLLEDQGDHQYTACWLHHPLAQQTGTDRSG